ncbi:MAG: CoA transferase [Xanthomonadales bacterium]|jgi:crotonobetainyl-CoA:carnitine CoA-transferase CaiB-like acyl-CoA transferase|nr:CoA transferase [Xanthomonadales bacterium]
MTPLEGVRILDLSRILAGPWCTQLLADLGADVLKIEHPEGGDDTRHWGPPWLKDGAGRDSRESAYFLACNRGKRSLTLDFTQPEGRARLLELAARADVLVENYKVGGLAKYGLDYASLSARFPGLVYCSITGYGQTGPYAHRAGYDAAIQALGGLMSLTGERDDRPGGGPQKVGVAVADLMAGMYAATTILAALRHRDRSGEGQHLDVSLLDCQVAWLANQASNYLIGGQVPGREGSAHPNIVPYQRFATADGFLMLAVGNDGQFARFATLAGHPEWATDPRYASNPARVAQREQLLPMVAGVLAARTTAEWLTGLEAVGVPAAPINDLAQVFDDPQVQARGLCVEVAHPNGGVVRMVRHPVRWSRTPPRAAVAPPTLGSAELPGWED